MIDFVQFVLAFAHELNRTIPHVLAFGHDPNRNVPWMQVIRTIPSMLF